jgi:hypothetical protein
MAACSCNSCCSTTATSVTYCERFCVLSFPACNVHAPFCNLCPEQFYSMFPHFRLCDTIKKSYWIQIVCFDILDNFCLTSLELKEKLSELWSNICIGLHVKYPLFLSDIHETCIISIIKKIKYQIWWKFFYLEPICWMWTDGQTRRR